MRDAAPKVGNRKTCILDMARWCIFSLIGDKRFKEQQAA
jgi:hypothetical protein